MGARLLTQVLARERRLEFHGRRDTSGLLTMPAQASALYVFAHGAGAGMEHPFMATVAEGLVDRGIATLRYNFPYMDKVLKRPDKPEVAHATVRTAVEAARREMPDVPLFAGGKSFGGRMTSQAQAADPMPGVQGLVFFGFPLHVAGKPSISRAEHLSAIEVPMLFLQGTRDELASMSLLVPLVEELAPRAELVVADGADHGFHVLKRSGRTDGEVMAEMLDRVAGWMRIRIA
jgi:uncharacterized protein